MSKQKKENFIQQHDSKYDLESAYQAAATTLALIIQTGESFVVREFNIRDNEFVFDYCSPNNETESETREVLAFVCQILGTIAGHALYSGELLSSKNFGLDDREDIESLDN